MQHSFAHDFQRRMTKNDLAAGVSAGLYGIPVSPTATRLLQAFFHDRSRNFMVAQDFGPAFGRSSVCIHCQLDIGYLAAFGLGAGSVCRGKSQ